MLMSCVIPANIIRAIVNVTLILTESHAHCYLTSNMITIIRETTGFILNQKNNTHANQQPSGCFFDIQI